MKLNESVVQWFRFLWLLFLLALPVYFWLIPINYFDGGAIGLCPSKWIFGTECYGCGTTRAMLHIHHGDWGRAWSLNRASFLTYSFFLFVWFAYLLGVLLRLGLLPEYMFKTRWGRKLKGYIPNWP